ncbi:MAG: DUF3794 domain-containing protein [Oscillospiraceae bacterium]|nr:DUF3794 domain-containing protein [Oscillospiraceae bacterium]
MELKKQTFPYYEIVLEAGASPEAGADMIVPDMFPDIAHILDTSGQACIKEKILREGRLDVSGLIRACIVYFPEGEQGLWKLDVNIPFNHVFDGEFPINSEALCEIRLASVHARTVNPRKVQVLCGLEIDTEVYAPAEKSLPQHLEGDCQVRKKSCTAYMPIGVKCKSFTVTESLEIPGTRPPVQEILRAGPRLTVSDVKAVGNKAVFKGGIVLQMSYMSDGGLNYIEQEFSLSQIIEFESLEEGAEVNLSLMPTGVEIDLGQQGQIDGHVLGISLHIEAQAVAWAERQMEAVVDAYSTSCRLKALFSESVMTELVDRGVRRQSIRELIEAGDDIRAVTDTRVVLGRVLRKEEGHYECIAGVDIVYQRENGEYGSLSRRIPVALSGEIPNESKIKASLNDELTAVPTAGGIELRFFVDFSLFAIRETRLMTVNEVEKEEWDTPPKHKSVVLLRCQAGKSLWDIAKMYHTTIDDLCAVNELEDCENISEGQLILIPKKR